MGVTDVVFGFQELLDGRDNLEQQLRDLTLQLGRVEEQRLSALKDAEKMKVRGRTLSINYPSCV